MVVGLEVYKIRCTEFEPGYGGRTIRGGGGRACSGVVVMVWDLRRLRR